MFFLICRIWVLVWSWFICDLMMVELILISIDVSINLIVYLVMFVNCCLWNEESLDYLLWCFCLGLVLEVFWVFFGVLLFWLWVFLLNLLVVCSNFCNCCVCWICEEVCLLLKGVVLFFDEGVFFELEEVILVLGKMFCNVFVNSWVLIEFLILIIVMFWLVLILGWLSWLMIFLIWL